MKRGGAAERVAGPAAVRGEPEATRHGAATVVAVRRRREVDQTDLERIGVLQALLLTLNDPRASAARIARHVRELEVLATRIEERLSRGAGSAPSRLIEQIAILGNRELETLLLGVLEDVVALHTELREGGGAGER